MTSIASLPIPTQTVTAVATSPAPSDSKPAIPVGKPTDAPVTIVSFSAKAAAASTPPQSLPTLNLDKVSNALSGLSAANGAAFIASHFNTAGVAAKFGEEFALHAKQGAISTAYNTISAESASAASAGIQFQNSIKSVDDVKAYAASGSSSPIISVVDFSFKSGGSTYSITNQSDGTLLGTKDGQVWQTWQLASVNSKTNFGALSETDTASSDAATALQTLTSLNANKASAKSLAPLDLSA